MDWFNEGIITRMWSRKITQHSSIVYSLYIGNYWKTKRCFNWNWWLSYPFTFYIQMGFWHKRFWCFFLYSWHRLGYWTQLCCLCPIITWGYCSNVWGCSRLSWSFKNVGNNSKIQGFDFLHNPNSNSNVYEIWRWSSKLFWSLHFKTIRHCRWTY